MLDKVGFHLINENTNPMPTHTAALAVKVEVLVLHVRHLLLDLKQARNSTKRRRSQKKNTYLSHVFLICLLDRFFVTFVIDQVYERCLPVTRYLIP
jgi:hypothetical protein